MYQRSQFGVLKGRIEEPRGKIQVVVGPRQVGKSTLVKQVLQSCSVPYLFETADGVEPDNAAWIGEVWESARMRMRLAGLQEYLLVIDEVHKISRWSEFVKREWDLDTFNGVGLKVVLLGSSRLLLKAGLNESLAGRFELIRMTHWSFAEMRDAFGWSLEQFIYFGGYPGSAPLAGHERRWEQYVRDAIVSPSIEKDVLLTTSIYKPQLMRQLFDLGCAYSGKELSLNKMLGQLTDAGNVTTLAGYLSVLAESGLLCGLQKYANDAARKYNSVPKLMVFNAALLTVQAGQTFRKAATTPQLWGRWVETAVGAHLLCSAEEGGYRVFYWREKNDEVDFVLERRGELVAIEVKGGRSTANAGLGLFKEKFSPKAAFVVGTGGVPLEEFLQSSPSLLF